eukprot:TRINITY_DN43291_c0_g1_i1.p1 TRINITY_DN43291_c0_g1~~TRINITY_DN43291_c0_g1_i1.p1  ORF type:complete len:1517 (+),score=273.65 TRINITY_DN43291_c0_g1_i1:213-4553(+)
MAAALERCWEGRSCEIPNTADAGSIGGPSEGSVPGDPCLVARKKTDEVLGGIAASDSVVSGGRLTAVLEALPWPTCVSRGNVRPEGAPYVHAFPFGMVQNYRCGLCCSRATGLWPDLASMVNRFFRQSHPEFKYTTVQLNRNYASKMHVDANNHGPSKIIAIGDYLGGELWLLDEGGDVPMRVPCVLKGYPYLRPGSTVMGRLVDCAYNWIEFDGNTPHMTMPFTGTRISIVCFTRRGWLDMPKTVWTRLEELSFHLPGPEYLSAATARDNIRVRKPKRRRNEVAVASITAEEEGGEVPEADEAETNDEMEEDEVADVRLRQEVASMRWGARAWAATFREHLGVSWGEGCIDAGRPLVLTCCKGSGAPCFAMEDLLEEAGGSFRMLAVVEPDADALAFAVKNCHPRFASATLDARDLQATGQRDSDRLAADQLSSHGDQTLEVGETKVYEDDLFVASLECATLVDRKPQHFTRSYVEDHSVAQFRKIRAHIEARRPRTVVLETTGLEHVGEAQRLAILGLVLDGKDPRDGSSWGLRSLAGFGIALVNLKPADFGLPLAGSRTHLVLVREDCGGQRAADAVVGIAAAFRCLMSGCAVQEVLFENDDPRVVETRRRARPPQGPVAAAAPATCSGYLAHPRLQRELAREARDLGIRSGEAPYTEFLRGSLQELYRDWFPEASPWQITQLNLVYERALQSGDDQEALIVDLPSRLPSQALLGRGGMLSSRSDGLLPLRRFAGGKEGDSRVGAGGGGRDSGSNAFYYSFARHRPLVGQEELLCLGFPVWRLNFDGLSSDDERVRRLAAGAPAVPVLGATLCALLAVVDFGRGRHLGASPSRLAQLLADASAVAGGDVAAGGSANATAASATAAAEAAAETAKMERMQGRAAALLNLLIRTEERVGEVDVTCGSGLGDLDQGATTIPDSSVYPSTPAQPKTNISSAADAALIADGNLSDVEEKTNSVLVKKNVAAAVMVHSPLLPSSMLTEPPPESPPPLASSMPPSFPHSSQILSHSRPQCLVACNGMTAEQVDEGPNSNDIALTTAYAAVASKEIPLTAATSGAATAFVSDANGILRIPQQAVDAEAQQSSETIPSTLVAKADTAEAPGSNEADLNPAPIVRVAPMVVSTPARVLQSSRGSMSPSRWQRAPSRLLRPKPAAPGPKRASLLPHMRAASLAHRRVLQYGSTGALLVFCSPVPALPRFGHVSSCSAALTDAAAASTSHAKLDHLGSTRLGNRGHGKSGRKVNKIIGGNNGGTVSNIRISPAVAALAVSRRGGGVQRVHDGKWHGWNDSTVSVAKPAPAATIAPRSCGNTCRRGAVDDRGVPQRRPRKRRFLQQPPSPQQHPSASLPKSLPSSPPSMKQRKLSHPVTMQAKSRSKVETVPVASPPISRKTQRSLGEAAKVKSAANEFDVGATATSLRPQPVLAPFATAKHTCKRRGLSARRGRA